MIEAEHAIVIGVDIDSVWNYVKDIQKWAGLFPGCRECTVIDDNNSRWIIKVGAGGLVRTVNVHVRIEQWSGPEQVLFSYQLESEPVIGGGSYSARRVSSRETEIALKVRVEGGGPMAPMWEAVSKPLLPQLAKAFSGKLKSEIETAAGATGLQISMPAVKPSIFGRLLVWLRAGWRRIIGT